MFDCNNCANHQQGAHPADVVVCEIGDVKTTCRDCLDLNLAYFTAREPEAVIERRVIPIKPVKTEKPDFKAISAERKGMPVFQGFLMYFPDAVMQVAKFSRINNDKHNPGQPLHWSKHKSNDHADCVGRHLIDIGEDWDGIDEESGEYHALALAWRSMALLQIVLGAKKAGLKPKAYLAKLKAESEGKA